MKKIIPIVLILAFFSVPAFAGDVAIIDHQINWISSCSHYSNYQWQVDMENASQWPHKIHLRIVLFDENGYILDTAYETAYLQANQQQTFCGSSHLNCASSVVKTSRVEIEDVREITH